MPVLDPSPRQGHESESDLCIPLQIAALRLLGFERFEKRLEVAFAEAAAAVPLDDFDERRRSILDRP